MAKRLLYIDHSFHNKTKSAEFLKELLQETYEIEFCEFDPYVKNPNKVFERLDGQVYDVLVLFQVMPDLKKLKEHVTFKHAALFPMFDACGGLGDEIWISYAEFNIINFSRTLHERLKALGLSSYYIQYFPKPYDEFKWGDPSSIYFWQRVMNVNLDLVERVFRHVAVGKVHLHKVLDPGHRFKSPSPRMSGKLVYSEWYDRREDMLRDMESCAFYMAPRLYEGIGMSFLEAMAMGRCVVAPDNPTMNEYITHGVNGFLYDSYFSMPLSSEEAANVREIQQNAYRFIKDGYDRWEVNKYEILDWLETPVCVTLPLYTKKVSKYWRVRSYRLFACLPICVVKEKDKRKRYYDLLGFLRVLKCKRTQQSVKYYLFGLLPVWEIKY